MFRDLRHAVRLARWNPWFTAVTVLTLALGLSTNATLFSLVNLLLFKPLPVKDAGRLVVLLEQTSGSDAPRGLSWADYRDYRAQVGEFSDTLALLFRPAYVDVTGHATERVWIEAVSGNYFSMLGVTPHAGRLFLPGEGQTLNADPIVVLSHQYWRTQLGADPTIVGRSIAINGQPLTVIGIASPDFTSAQWTLAPGAFVPATMLPALFAEYRDLLERRTGGGPFRVMAHLRPDVELDRATAAVQVVTQRLVGQYRPDQKNARVVVWPEPRTRPVPNVSRFVPFAAAIFMLMAGLVLFIACANVANLMFSRALARQREMSIRAAVGASRRRLVQQLLTESLFLALIAGGISLLLSFASGQLLARLVPQGDIPVRPDDRWDWVVASFTVLAALAAGLITGLVPALRSTGLDVNDILKGGGAGGPARAARQGFRSQLVISQVAVAVVVLVCGGVFLQSLQGLAQHDLGFRADRLAMASLDLALPGYDEARGRRLLDQLPERMRALAGVEAAAIGSSVPFDNSHEIRVLMPADGDAAGEPGDRDRTFRAGVNRVDPGYLRAMGATLLQGRDFTPDDRASMPRVAIVNQTLARRLWPGRDPIGQRFRWQRGDAAGEPVEVVGIVRDGKYVAIGEAPRAYAYVPLLQNYSASVTLHVRAARGDPLALTSALRRVVQDLAPEVPVFNVRTMDEHLRGSVFAFLPIRMGALLASAQGALALLLAMMSVYGVVAWSVSRQTRTIGVHVALGAQPRDLFLLVSRSALRPALIGLAIGIAASIACARMLARLLYGLDPMNLPVFATVVALVLGVSLLACWLPARRALRVDPITALRAE